jgi:CDGSH-type Zn-finger protein
MTDTPKVFAKYPVEVELEQGKLYSFCTCGYSDKQPFCDGAHREKAPDYKSFKFEAEKDGKVWLCQCKQTHGAPFCDGSHKEL